MRSLLLIAAILFLTACNIEPVAINYGKDNCDFCKMTIMDQKFSAECISKKGKTFKFDDVHCLRSFIQNGGVWSNEIGKVYFSDYKNNGKWIESDKALLLKSEGLKSPMGGNIAAFSNEADRDEASKQFNGEKLVWDQIKQQKH